LASLAFIASFMASVSWARRDMESLISKAG
jgi:hypothetical protein